MCKTPISAIVATFCASFLALSANANMLQSITASPSQVNVNDTVTFTVQKTGADSCIAVVEYGNGQQSLSFVLTNTPASSDYAYPAAGVFTATVRGDGALGCVNTPTTVVTVSPPPTRPGATIDEGQTIKPIAPSRGPDKGRTITPLPPKRGADAERPLFQLPRITSHIFEPVNKNGGLVWAAPGVLAPGGRLHLNGVGFGATGLIQVSGIGADDTYLTFPTWSDTLVSGVLLPDLGGDRDDRVPVTVRVLNSENKKWSLPYSLEYENPFTTRMLTMNDAAVRVVECGDDGNMNTCNKTHIKAGDCVEGWSPWTGIIPFGIPAPPSPPPTVYGMHFNCGTIGDDTGTDRFEISLANGWFVHDVVEQEEDNSSDDEEVDFSQVPTGEGVSNLTVSVDWTATPNDDNVRYWMRLEAKGPMIMDPF